MLLITNAYAEQLTPEYEQALVNAIYRAEGGAATRHPYGVLTKYKHTSPRQACINTLRSKHKAWVKAGKPKTYLEFLRDRYAPISNCANDPTKLNRNWLKNVRHFLEQNR